MNKECSVQFGFLACTLHVLEGIFYPEHLAKRLGEKYTQRQQTEVIIMAEREGLNLYY